MRIAPLLSLAVALPAATLLADSPATQMEDAVSVDIVVPDIDFTTQTLDNGLRVIYAPMDNAPVVHVRVLYHVGSKDEQPNRQGFAHLFEHMMFSGSEHVANEEHMASVNGVGGNSNAFTSFDQTAYVNTVPSNALEMALYLEADRMASFKVDAQKFTTERSVVNEEYLLRVANPPYGKQSIDFFNLAFDESHYQWTPIGDMDQLLEAQPQELQDFFDLYYVPNNAVLAIAGDFDVDEAKEWVESYYGWIPRGADVPRPSPTEPEQTERKEKTVYVERAPLASLTLAFKAGGWADDDVIALEVLGNILGTGRSSRMYQALVAGADGKPPLAQQASAGMYRLEDAGLMFASIFVLPGQDPAAVEKATMDVLNGVAEEGVTDEELAKAKTQMKLAILRGQQTADSVAGSLAEAWAFGGDPQDANNQADKIDAITSDDIARVAKHYLKDSKVSTLTYLPGRDPEGGDTADEQVKAAVEGMEAAEEAPSTQPMSDAAKLDFPESYPTKTPIPTETISADFNTGEEFAVGDTDVILIQDTRLPLVGMTLIMNGFGGDALPDNKVGLASLAADLLTRGSAGRSATEQNEQLDALGISLSAGDGGDHTSVNASFPKQASEEAANFVSELLTQPNFDEREFMNLRARAAGGLQQALSDPSGVAAREFDTLLFGDAPAGRSATPAVIAGLSLDDAVAYADTAYKNPKRTLILAGDMNRDEAEAFANKMLGDVTSADVDAIADETYTLGDYQPKILLVDNPGGGQAAVRMGNRSFKSDSDEKYAASVATQILSGGIESRLNRAMRAEKGLTYGAGGRFGPSRHSGDFAVGFATKPETTAEAITTAFDVLKTMASEPVTEVELLDAQRRVAGSLVLSQQTVGQLSGLRSSILLNDYPLDYYNTYGEKISAVTAQDVQNVVATYGNPENFSIVVVAPADIVEEQLSEFGEVTVVPMPLARTAQ